MRCRLSSLASYPNLLRLVRLGSAPHHVLRSCIPRPHPRVGVILSPRNRSSVRTSVKPPAALECSGVNPKHERAGGTPPSLEHSRSAPECSGCSGVLRSTLEHSRAQFSRALQSTPPACIYLFRFTKLYIVLCSS